MKPIAINPLIISAISSIGILCCGCQEKSEEKPDDTSVEEAGTTEISNQLDLEVVISVFGESENLEDFENKLNEPDAEERDARNPPLADVAPRMIVATEATQAKPQCRSKRCTR